MTIDEAITHLENDWFISLSGQVTVNADDKELFLEAINMAISALRSQQEAEKNEPLTLDRLRNMHGYPVWITPSGFWAIVIAKPGERVMLRSGDGETVFADKEIELVGPVYRRPPGKDA